MSDYAKLSARKLNEVVTRTYARWGEMLDATIAAGMGQFTHSDMVEAAKRPQSSRGKLAFDYLTARHDWKTAKDELDARRTFHGSDRPIGRK